MEKAYICSPLSGNTKENLKNAVAYARFVFDRCGMIPVMSHFYVLILDDNIEFERKIGTSLGLEMILDARHMWVFGDNITPGMKDEIRLAESLKRVIHYVTDEQCEEIQNKYGGYAHEKNKEFEIAI
jgi:hypothetical protein